MIIPKILFYAKFELNTANGKKTPKYTLTAQAGYYPPMEQLKDRQGKVNVYLMEKLKEGERVPAMRLQAKNSYNFTGLKDYFLNGKLSGFAYGYPYDKQTYSKDKKPNPFYNNRNDCYLFKMGGGTGCPQNLPQYFEMVVIEGGKILASSYCKMMLQGGFNEALEQLRQQTKN